MRGVLHQVSFFIALAAGISLTSQVPEGFRWGTVVYVLSLTGLLGISALYHRPLWSPAVRQWLRRADHAAIVLLIAGTATPIGMLLPEPINRHFLIAIWVGGAFGIARALFWIGAPKYVAALVAVGLGWSLAPFLGDMYTRLGLTSSALIVLGGLIYSVGAIVYAKKRPDPWPKTFGYHEIFHALVVLAAGLHFVVICRATLQ